MSDVQNKLRSLLDNIAKGQGFVDYKLYLTPISTGGANYNSTLYKCKIEEKDNSLNLFIKVSAMNPEYRESIGVNLYDEEKYVYTRMKEIFTDLEDKYKVPEEHRLVLPKYYGGDTTPGEEILIFEDLSAQGFLTYDRLKPIDWIYAAAAVTELAKFHALAMAFQKEYTEEHRKFLATYGIETAAKEEMFKQFWKNGLDRAVEVAREENKEKLQKFVDKVTAESINKLYQAERKLVLTHSDFKASNLMYRVKEGDFSAVIIVDYQTVQGGCVLMDLLYFILTTSDEEFRRKHFDQLVEYYFSQLSASMMRLGLSAEDYSREDFDYELKEKLPYALILAVCVLPPILVETDAAPKVEQGIDISSFSGVKANELSTERINGVINDYVRWGILK